MAQGVEHLRKDVNSLSQKLLEGWTMLVDTCPQCHTPLVRSPDKAQTLCVNCPQANGNVTGQLPQKAATRGISPMLEEENEIEIEEVVRDDKTVERQRLDRMAKMEESSAAIAEKLLQGWTLLNEHCPRCFSPLMRGRQQKHMMCVVCNLPVLTEDQAKAPTTSDPHQKRKAEEAEGAEATVHPPPEVVPPSPSAALQECFQHLSAASPSSSASDRLPGVHDRLHASRDKGVSLGRWDGQEIVREPKRLATSALKQGLGLLRARVPGGEPVEIEMATHSFQGGERQSPKYSGGLRGTQGVPVTAVALDNIASRTVVTLTQKLEESRLQLEACHDVRDMKVLIETIRECAQAIAALQGLVKKD